MDVKHNKKPFYKLSQQKERQGKTPSPLLLVGANIVTKDEKMSEVINAFFASAFNSKSGCCSTRPPELENRDGEQKEILIIHEEVVSVLLHLLDTQKSMGPDGTHSRILGQPVEVCDGWTR